MNIDIQIEFGDIGNIMAYISIGDRIQDIERLVGALAEISRIYSKEEKRFEVDRQVCFFRGFLHFRRKLFMLKK